MCRTYKVCKGLYRFVYKFGHQERDVPGAFLFVRHSRTGGNHKVLSEANLKVFARSCSLFPVILRYEGSFSYHYYNPSVISTVAEKSISIIFLCIIFFHMPVLSSARRRGGSFFSLDRKETKDQGLDLMSDKFVKALRSPAQAPMKDRGGCAASGQW